MVDSNVTLKANVVLATPWNVFRFRALHLWWRVSDMIRRFFKLAY